MRLLYMSCIFMSFSLLAQEVSLKNDREGASFYASASTTRSINRALKSLPASEIESSFKESLSGVTANRLCSFDLNARFLENLRKKNKNFTEFKGALHHIRSVNEIDDTVLRILLKAQEVTRTSAGGSSGDLGSDLPHDPEKTKELLDIIASYDEKLTKNCLDDTYSSLHGEINKAFENVRGEQLEDLFEEARYKKLISQQNYLKLEQARLNDLQNFRVDLKSYYQKVKHLRAQYPLRDPKEQSVFISSAFPKTGMSRRQRLLESYSDIQIILMGNVIKKLRSRLEAPKIEILVYEKEGGQEVIPLEPMERFRFAIKVLRKEMQMMSLNTYFHGRSPDYTDLISAAYEVGIIPASEVDEIASLQDIWSPQKNFWQKSMVWIRTFSTVATVMIPPPYGFLPALGIVVIEATVGKEEKVEETGLF